jgi:hypothetical protein
VAASTYNLLIEQGATFTLSLVWRDSEGDAVDLTGYSARMQVRPSVTSEDVLLTLDSDGNGITLGGNTGAVAVLATAAQTELIAAKRGVYDLELEAADGTVTRLLQGAVTISPEVTR